MVGVVHWPPPPASPVEEWMDGSRLIPLTKGQSAIVDEEDFLRLSAFKLYAQWNPLIRGFYAARRDYPTGRPGIMVFMHREILGLTRGDRRQGDHANCQTLDNRRSNLRIATRSQNMTNKPLSRNNKSGFKGVCYSASKKKYIATIRVDGKRLWLGSFVAPTDAHEAYKEAAITHFGAFARWQ